MQNCTMDAEKRDIAQSNEMQFMQEKNEIT